MKKRIILIIMVFAVLSLSARPQFFVGGGAEWGRVHPTENMLSVLKGNERYFKNETWELKYFSFLIPKLGLTVIPYTDFPLGLTVEGGFGYITETSTGRYSYNFSPVRNSVGGYDYYRYGSDNVILVSGGLTYIHLADSDKYFSVSASLKYNWNRYILSNDVLDKWKKVKERNDMVIDEHSVSVGIGMMGRYDAEYFRLDAALRKDLDYEKGVSSLFDGDGYSFSISMTFGYVFTILNEHQFMR